MRYFNLLYRFKEVPWWHLFQNNLGLILLVLILFPVPLVFVRNGQANFDFRLQTLHIVMDKFPDMNKRLKSGEVLVLFLTRRILIQVFAFWYELPSFKKLGHILSLKCSTL